ncbi:MAG TPA: branched-chain amino acid ABC transporter permease [Firmicutes bacterium]|nr:branched-chain amino acid ABC transporter permease [Bacillota bacterium]
MPLRWMTLAMLLLLTGMLALAQAFLNPYYLSIIEFIGIYIILTVSLNLTNGFTGLFSLGHPGFMAIGAYVATLLTFPVARKPLMLPNLPAWLAHIEIPFLPALITGGIAASIAAVVIGFPVLRLRGHYLALATLGFIIIMSNLITNLRDITRGPLGINGIPAATTIWLVFGWAVITVYVCWRILNSSFGRALLAIREDEVAASVMGIHLTKYKLFAFVTGAFFAGIAGGLWAHLVTAITPRTFWVPMAFNLVVMVVIGGSGSITGAIIGAAVMSVLAELLRPIETTLGLYGLIQLITATILIVILIYRPEGIMGHNELNLAALVKVRSFGVSRSPSAPEDAKEGENRRRT